MRTLRLTFAVLTVSLIIAGCAQVMPITGGEQDTTSPQILESSPSNFSTNFEGNKIELKFDEYVKLSQISQEFISSPPLKYKPDFIEKGKTITMTISDTLLPNTTYNMNFGNGIVDFTEGNVLDSNLFVFSTGDKLDSLVISGVIVDAFTGEPIEGVTALLHTSLADSAPYTLRPDYISKSKEGGIFSIGYLPNKEFQLNVVEDKNANFKIDGSAERIGFVKSSISSDNDTAIYKIKLFKPLAEKQLISKAKPEDFTLASMKFDLPVKEFKMSALNEPNSIGFYEQWNDNRDSLVFNVYPGREQDSLQLLIEADSIIDTVIFKMPSYEKFLKSKEKGDPSVSLSFQANTTAGVHAYFDTLYIKGNHPFATISKDSISLVSAGDTLSADSFQLITVPIDGMVNAFEPEVALLYPWKQGFQYQLIYYPGAIVDVYGLKSTDTLTQSFRTLSFEDYGKLTIRLENWDADQMILELLTSERKLVKKEIISSRTESIVYDVMEPGTYGMRIIIDHDKNGRWTTGNLKKKTLPEEVYYFPEQIDVRANWEIDYDWQFAK